MGPDFRQDDGSLARLHHRRRQTQPLHCALPLGSTALAARAVDMENLIGHAADRWPEILADPTAHSTSTARATPAPAARWATSPA